MATATPSFAPDCRVCACSRFATTLAAGTLAVGMLTSAGVLMTGMVTIGACCRDNVVAALQARPIAIEDWLAPGVWIEATVVVAVAEVEEAAGVTTGSAHTVADGAVFVGLAATVAG